MILKMFSVYDSKLEAYMQPFFAQTKGHALRLWSDNVNDPSTNNPWFKHPADFTLFEIGEFDDNTGRVKQYEVNSSLGTALEFKKEEGAN